MPSNKKRYCKSYLQTLQTVQGKIARIITGTIKATALLALDIEIYVFPLHFQLEKLVEEAVFRLA